MLADAQEMWKDEGEFLTAGRVPRSSAGIALDPVLAEANCCS